MDQRLIALVVLILFVGVAQAETMVRVHIDSAPEIKISGHGISIADKSLSSLPSFEKIRIAVKLVNAGSAVSSFNGLNGVTDFRGNQNSSNYKSVGFAESSHRRKNRVVWIIRTRKNETKLVAADLLAVNGDFLRLGIKAAPNEIILIPNIHNGVDVIANVPIDDYLRGVLVGEMPLNWPAEALKAQVVAARSYVLALIKERKRFSYDVRSTIFDQVYEPITSKAISFQAKAKLEQAIKETSGLVLTNSEGGILKAHYHADSGGVTVPATSVWGNAGTARAVAREQFNSGSPYQRWQYRIGADLLIQKMSRWRGGHAAAKLADIVIERDSSGRVQWFHVKLADGSTLTMPGHEMREMVGFSLLKSTLFDVRIVQDVLLFTGRGFGHGVGMSQWGSRYLAESGWTFDKILSFYYGEARIGKVINKKQDI